MLLANVTSIIKNIWFLGATISASTAGILVVIEKHQSEFGTYSVEIGVGLFSVLFLTLFIIYYLLHKKVCGIVDYVKDGFKSLETNALIKDVEDFYYRHIGYDSLHLYQAERLHALDARRKKINKDDTLTEELIKRLLIKPVRG